MIDYTVSREDVNLAYEAEWGKDWKMGYYADTDGIPVEKAEKDAFLGNLGEIISYNFYTNELGLDCKFPDFSIKKGAKLWPDDLVFNEAPIIKLDGDDVQLIDNQSVKAQLYSVGKRWGESWIWQIKRSRGGHPDPMTTRSDVKSLFIGVQIDDVVWDKASKEDVPCKIGSFYWPTIFQFLADPRVQRYVGWKKAIYLKDIKNFEIDVDTLKGQQVLTK